MRLSSPSSTPSSIATAAATSTAHLALTTNDTGAFVALRLCRRFSLVCTLQQSLFGVVKLATEAATGQRVCIKISVRTLCAVGRSVCGVSVLEDVRRESNLLRFLTAHAANDYTQDEFGDVSGGAHIVRFVDTFEDDEYHYLITEYVEGDLFTLLRSLPLPAATHNQPAHVEPTAGIAETRARSLFIQLCRAVAFVHRHHIAHCDVSIENICVSRTGKLTLIDFGLARMHPLSPYADDTRALTADAEANAIECAKFFPSRLWRTSTQSSFRPGKTAYMSAEVYESKDFDLYANDTYALAVVLYTALTGRPPYFRPTISDEWYQLIVSSAWCDAAVRQSGVGRYVWSELSQSAVDCMDAILKPQQQRASVQAILAHAFIRGPSAST